jgi:hypothetical protein
MDRSLRDELIRQYRAGHTEVLDALGGLADDRLDDRSGPDEWTPREVVHHLADAEMIAAVRLRRLLAEEGPEILGYDEQEYTRRLHYDRPIEPSLAAFKAARDTSAEILERLSEEEWERAGVHSERGRYSVEMWLEIMSSHGHDHAEQIRRAAKG